jgi:2-dehydro-3-deoxygalactonokinase
MPKLPDKFLSCDWGTSSFRLRLVSTSANEVLAEATAPTGVKDLYERGQFTGTPRHGLFAEIVAKHIAEIALRHTLNGQPLIISGMASSTIGWKELPYATVPFTLDARGLVVEELRWESPEGLGPTYIVSGVAGAWDMMRGEECQVIGLLAERSLRQYRERSLVILPGTHSKHLFVQHGKVIAFQTYMTGEIFDTLSKHTILSATVEANASVKAHLLDFKAGIKCAKEEGLAGSLFRVRTRGVLQKTSRDANAAFLSGVLIGAELETIVRHPTLPIIVAANENLLPLYTAAIPQGADVVFTSAIDRATMTAHRLILAHVLNEVSN